MKLADFDYILPKELIAQYPLKQRTQSRLLVVERKNAALSHNRFYDLVDFLKPGDTLVLNNTKVKPVRLTGQYHNRKIDILLIKREQKNCYAALIKPGKKIKPKDKIIIGNNGIYAELQEEKDVKDFSIKTVIFYGTDEIENLLGRLGTMPLPPYIKRLPDAEDVQAYQTVYAKHPGAVAAPTAGLHFTDKLLEDLKNKGVNIAYLTLHVGYGTFKPVRSEDLSCHYMHEEYYEINQQTADLLNLAVQNKSRIAAVGTTVVRTLETIARKIEGDNCEIMPQKGTTNLFIYPPYKFKIVDVMLTNFHLPRTTLLILVSAFCGHKLLLTAYNEAIRNKYRFYSYGDAMLIL
ncbi:MAG: tRNA preQ1(34) S-adenosylmethionine ribosyltransferase-isomerase QueA [Candidatus Omnitrophota bacterium]